VIAGEIVDDLRAALEQFEAIQTDLSRKGQGRALREDAAMLLPEIRGCVALPP